MPKPPGTKDVHPPEKLQHAQHLSDALADALRKWEAGDPTEVTLRFEASISPNPGGVHQYRCFLLT